jgi:guanosine-3',5'-bis(diphosphate) 3'-pyrophosphohydrolase
MLSYAAEKHKKQRRLGVNRTPFINHPIEVCRILSEVGGITDEDILCASLCHDILEDTPTTFEDLEMLFGFRVANLVRECSDDKSLPKQERKRLQIVHTKTISDDAKLIKLADKIANMQSLLIDPPNWKLERKIKSFLWSYEVVGWIQGLNPELEEMFSDIFEQKDLLT